MTTKPAKPTALRVLLSNPSVTPREAILAQNRYDKELLKRVVAGEISIREFKAQWSERLNGQWQWGTDSYNIRSSDSPCRNICNYCYATSMGKHFGWNITPPAEGKPMVCDRQKVNKSWMRVMAPEREMYFFPSTSDIFPEMMENYVIVVKKIIGAGHQVFFTTKPTIQSITSFINLMEASESREILKANTFIYVTIGTSDATLLRRFEPRSSLYEERVVCLHLLAERGFHVNVMMEPYLSDPIPLIQRLLPLLPPDGVIAVGKMNYGDNLIFSPDPAEERRLRVYLEQIYSVNEVRKLWFTVAEEPRVFLKKDTLLAVMKAFGHS